MENRYGLYRQIRSERTWRPLGKMSWWRIVLGLALLLLVFLISGFVSQQLASAGYFKAARSLMISPGWVERYKPQLKLFIDAGVLFQDGDYDAAMEVLSMMEDSEAVSSMKNISALKLAEARLQSGDDQGAKDALAVVKEALLSGSELEEYTGLRALLSKPADDPEENAA